jgi:hypothetical protein
MIDLPAEWEPVLATQQGDGAFLSHAHLRDGPIGDHNGFATALVLDCLWQAPDLPAIAAARDRALTFLQGCVDPSCPGRFGFYPPGTDPGWMVPSLACDADDTALFNLALLRAGSIDKGEVARVICEVLRPFRLTFRNERSQPWHRFGVFETWLDAGICPNPIDCTVNVNVLTLLHASGTDYPEAAAITEMAFAAAEWAGLLKARAARSSPWYPDPIEFVFAVERAARAGVPRMATLSNQLHRLDWVIEDKVKNLPICGSSDGRIVWTCPALFIARAILARRAAVESVAPMP